MRLEVRLLERPNCLDKPLNQAVICDSTDQLAFSNKMSTKKVPDISESPGANFSIRQPTKNSYVTERCVNVNTVEELFIFAALSHTCLTALLY